MKIKEKGDCSFVVNTKNRNQGIKFNNKMFNVCKNTSIDVNNVTQNCNAVSLDKVIKKSKYKIIKVKKVIMKAVKSVARLAIKSNPGNNDKTVKNTFKDLIKKNLLGLIVKGSKTVSRIKKVTLRRVEKKIKLTIVFRRYYRIIDNEKQI